MILGLLKVDWNSMVNLSSTLATAVETNTLWTKSGEIVNYFSDFFIDKVANRHFHK